MAEPVKTRRYDASRRRAAAAERRRAILRAAADLFLADGYPQTTIAAIAARAGVSEDLIFTLFTNKRGVLKHVMDVGIGGDDQDIPLLERQGPQTMRHSSDQHEQLRLFAAGITAQLERVAPYNDLVRTAASVEPEIAALQDDLHLRQRRLAMTTIAGWIEANGPLQDGITREHAAAILWTLAGPDVYRMLTKQWGWTRENYQQWLARTLEASILPHD
jgi:AcrR family transcriptional regulator